MKIERQKNCPTKRALDGWDSAAFSGFIYARTESCSQSFIYARPPASNANRWAVNEKKIGIKPRFLVFPQTPFPFVPNTRTYEILILIMLWKCGKVTRSRIKPRNIFPNHVEKSCGKVRAKKNAVKILTAN